MNILDKKWKKKMNWFIRNTIADIVLYIKEEELLNWLKYINIHNLNINLNYWIHEVLRIMKFDIWKKAIKLCYEKGYWFFFVGICRSLKLEDVIKTFFSLFKCTFNKHINCKKKKID